MLHGFITSWVLNCLGLLEEAPAVSMYPLCAQDTLAGVGEAPVVGLYPWCAQGACAGDGEVSVLVFVACL